MSENIAEENIEKNIDKSEKMDFIGNILEQLELPKPETNKYSPLTFAYLGDCVYEIVIRTMFVYQGNTAVQKLHSRSCHLVKAKTQSDMIKVLEEELTEEEIAIFKRGRNAYSPTRAKNASMSDYRRATGFEALMGYLYMEKRYSRIVELVRKGLEALNEAPWKKDYQNKQNNHKKKVNYTR